MATRYFTGGNGDGDVSQTSNWDTYPVDGDTAIIDRTAYDITGSIETTGTAINLLALRVGPGWTGTQLGTVSQPFKFKATGSSRTVDIELNPRCYLAVLYANTTVDILRITGTGSGQAVLTSGTFTESQINGNALIGASAVCTTHYALSGNQKAEAGTAFTTLYVNSGCTLESARNLGTCYIDGTAIPTAAAASTLAVVSAGGTLNVKSSGTHAAVDVRRFGSFSLDGCKKDVTVTLLRDHVGSSRVDRTGKGISVSMTYKPVGKTA